MKKQTKFLLPWVWCSNSYQSNFLGMLHKDRATTKIISQREFPLLLQIHHVEAYTIRSPQINKFAFIQVVVNNLPTGICIGGGGKGDMFESKGTLDFFCSNNERNQLKGQLRNSIYNQAVIIERNSIPTATSSLLIYSTFSRH